MSLSSKTCTPCKGGVTPLTLTEAETLLQDLEGWALEQGALKISKKFVFKSGAQSFQHTLEFVNKVGALAEEQGHHPDITFGWGYAVVAFYTHKIQGLHQNDFIMAAKVDALTP